jgi:hypothetical protein
MPTLSPAHVRSLAFAVAVFASAACAIQGKRESSADRPVVDGKERDFIEIKTSDPDVKSSPPVGFEVEEVEEIRNKKTQTTYVHKIRLQMRCRGGLTEAPLRGKILSWNWEGVKKSRTVSDTEGFISVLHRSPQRLPNRNFAWKFGTRTGTVDLSNGPYLLVFEGSDCNPRR